MGRGDAPRVKGTELRGLPGRSACGVPGAWRATLLDAANGGLGRLRRRRLPWPIFLSWLATARAVIGKPERIAATSGCSSKPTPERKTHVSRGMTHVVHPRGSRQMRMLPSQSRNLTRVGPCDRDKDDLPTKRAVVRILVAPHDLSRPQR